MKLLAEYKAVISEMQKERTSNQDEAEAFIREYLKEHGGGKEAQNIESAPMDDILQKDRKEVDSDMNLDEPRACSLSDEGIPWRTLEHSEHRNTTAPSWLPKWSDPREYEHLTVTDNNQSETPRNAFAWEFLRRNPSYQDDYNRLMDMASQHKATDYYVSGTTLSISRSSHMPGAPYETPYRAFHAELYRALTKWGLASWFPSPHSDLYNTPKLEALWRMGYNTTQAIHVFYDNGEPIPLHGGIIPTDEERFLLFDISRPLTPQIEKIKKYLESQQMDKYDKLKHSSRIKAAGRRQELNKEKQYVTYLRILDADATGASSVRIINQFVKENVLEHAPGIVRNTQGNHNNPSQTKLQAWRKSALSLRNEGYLSLM